MHAVGRRAASLAARLPHAVRALQNAPELAAFDTSRQLMPHGGVYPLIAKDALAPNCTLVGDVTVEDAASVGYGCVLRGDLAPIRLGAQSSLGDRVVVGTARSVPTGLSPAASIGRNVTVGPGSLLRSATVEDEVVVGARCTLLEGSVVETGAVLEPGTLLPPGRRVPARQVWGGAPAHFVRDTGYDEAAAVVRLSEDLAVLGAQHKEARLPLADEALYEEAAAVRAGLAAAAAARAGAGAGAIAAGGASEAGRVAA